jgi:hypothetical protein
MALADGKFIRTVGFAHFMEESCLISSGQEARMAQKRFCWWTGWIRWMPSSLVQLDEEEDHDDSNQDVQDIKRE